MREIKGQNFPHERDLYGVKDVKLIDCSVDGEEDGESALKEAQNVELERCFMNLRYPLWHDENVRLHDVTMTDKCRAALWYTNGIEVRNSRLLGIKALRECSDARIFGSRIVSPEFGWKCNGVTLNDVDVESEYLFLLSSGLHLQNVRFKGKYSFQYVNGALIEDCVFDTKDAFWHTKDVTVKNSVVKGEYLAWYSENLTLINCKISGTQPFCYCKGLKLIDCEMDGADFSFEYSDVEASVQGEVLSVKNPRSGKIVADGYGEIILTDDSKYPCNCEIVTRKK